MRRISPLLLTAILLLTLAGCEQKETTPQQSQVSSTGETTVKESLPSASETPIKAGLYAEQVLSGADGDIHYSYYLPNSYDGNSKYPMIVTMPGYDMTWFGEESSGSNLNWKGFTAWTQLDTEMIVVSAQLSDWHEKSARQAVELTEYFIKNFAVDTDRIYAAGYSAGGETMSQAVSMCPDLYAAYLHGASQWDGSYDPVAKSGVAVYIYMAESDEYYSSDKARSAYENLHTAYKNHGWNDEKINRILRLEIPNNAFFNEKGIYNYHGGANILFDDPKNLNWVISQSKGGNYETNPKTKACHRCRYDNCYAPA